MKKQKRFIKMMLLFLAVFILTGSGNNFLVSYGAEYEEVEAKTSIKLSKNQEQSKITGKVSGVRDLKDGEKIKLCVTSKVLGKDFVKWYKTKKVQGEYKGSFSISDFKNVTGKYYVSAYLESPGKEKVLLASKTITIKGIEGGKLSFQEINHEDGTCKVKITGLTAPATIKKVKVLVWSAKNNQNDAQWYRAKKVKNSWYIEFDTENHDYYSGKYVFQAKVWDGRGVSVVLKEKKKTIRVNTKVTTTISSNSTQSKYTVTIKNVRKVEPLDKVMIAVWGKENGENDKKWYTAKDKGNGTYQATIDVGKHKESGKYQMETYVKLEECEKQLENKKNFQVNGISATDIKFSYQNDEKGSVQIEVKGVSSPAGISKVEVSTYTTEKGKDDIITKEAIEAGELYKSTLSVVEHEFATGKYNVDVTITDNRGIVRKCNTRNIQMNCSEGYKQKITFSGIDVSRYQGNIDWNRVKAAGIDFVMIQVGYRNGQTGVITEDRCFERNIQGALAAGIDVGVYFFSQAITEEEAREEAAWAVKKVAPYKITYPITIDSEYRKNGRANSLNAVVRTNVVNAFCSEVKKNGYKAMIYASKSWFEDNLIMGYLSEYEVWLARYHTVPEYTGTFHMWQYTNEGHVDGISGYVDRNVGYKRYY